MGGSNYNNAIGRVGLGALPGVLAAKREACARGEHEEAVVTARWAVYAPFGRRRPVGERFCQRCLVVLSDEEVKEHG